MPLDVRGCTRATLTGSACAYPTPAGAGNPLNPIRDGDRGLQLFPMNEEFPVSAGHKLALIKSLPFVHTARRTYRLNGSVKISDCGFFCLVQLSRGKLFKPHHLEEGEVVTRFP